VDIPGYDIRYTQVGDLEYLRAWLKSPGMLHWFAMQAEKEVEDAAQCWIGFSRWSSSLTAVIDNVPCAIGTLFLMPYRKVAHQALLKLIVDPQHQRKGIGFSLLKNLKHLAKHYFRLELVNIEVVETNPILELLKKHDFYEVVRQEKFFKEDGNYFARVVMEAKL